MAIMQHNEVCQFVPKQRCYLNTLGMYLDAGVKFGPTTPQGGKGILETMGWVPADDILIPTLASRTMQSRPNPKYFDNSAGVIPKFHY